MCRVLDHPQAIQASAMTLPTASSSESIATLYDDSDFSIGVEDISRFTVDIASKAGPLGWQRRDDPAQLQDEESIAVDDEVATQPPSASDDCSAEGIAEVALNAETEDNTSAGVLEEEEEDSSSDEDEVFASGGCSSFERRLEYFPRGTGDHAWKSHNEAAFEVRAAKYFKDRKKQPAGPSLLELINIDFFAVGADGPITNAVAHPDLCPAALRRKGDNRFLFVLNWIFPPHQCVIVGALDPDAEWLVDDTPHARVWRRFLDMSDDERKDVLKILFNVVEGSWIVRSAAPKKPLIVGKSLTTSSHFEPGRHLEIIIDISTSKQVQVATNMMMRNMKGFQLAMAVVIEARGEDELPEAPLLCPTLRNLNTERLQAPRSMASRRNRRASTAPLAAVPITIAAAVEYSTSVSTAPIAAAAEGGASSEPGEALDETVVATSTERPRAKTAGAQLETQAPETEEEEELDLAEAEVPYCSVPGTPVRATSPEEVDETPMMTPMEPASYTGA